MTPPSTSGPAPNKDHHHAIVNAGPIVLEAVSLVSLVDPHLGRDLLQWGYPLRHHLARCR
jgi:hypothetical protein